MSSDMTDSTEVSLVEEEENGIVVLSRTQPSSKFNSWHIERNMQNDYMFDVEVDKSPSYYPNVTFTFGLWHEPSVRLSVCCLTVCRL